MLNNLKINKAFTLLVISIIFLIIVTAFIITKEKPSTPLEKPVIEESQGGKVNITKFTKEVYTIPTADNFEITLTRYIGHKKPPIILIHGMGGNHLIFDWDKNHSLARFLAADNWDVWLLDLRTHDGDGDFLFGKLRGLDSDREYMNRYWDFDRTYLKKDVVAAVEFVKEKTKQDKIILGGQSYGGYLAYAYAELIGENDLAGIITTGASPYANPEDFQPSFSEMNNYGFYLGEKAFVRPFGHPYTTWAKYQIDYYIKNFQTAETLFCKDTTSEFIQKDICYCGDNEPAGVWVDIYFGKNPRKYDGHWVDPQTLYDYSANLHKITVPIIFIAGENDLQDPSDDVYKAYESVSSEYKKFLEFDDHSHLDLVLGDDAKDLIFPEITDWLNSIFFVID